MIYNQDQLLKELESGIKYLSKRYSYVTVGEDASDFEQHLKSKFFNEFPNNKDKGKGWWFIRFKWECVNRLKKINKKRCKVVTNIDWSDKDYNDKFYRRLLNQSKGIVPLKFSQAVSNFAEIIQDLEYLPLSNRQRRICKLLIQKENQTRIAKDLNISNSMVTVEMKKIKDIIRKYAKNAF